MNVFALIRFTRQHSEDDEVIRAVFAQRGQTAPETLGPADFWDQILSEIAGSDLPTKGARLLHFEEVDGGPGEDRYIAYGVVPSIDDEAVEHAARLQKAGYDNGMAGFFQVIAMVSPSGVGLLYPADEALDMTARPALAA